VVKEEISLDAFHSIGLSFHGNVVLTQGSTQKVTIEAQQNIIDNIKREVKSGKWNIGFEKNVKESKPVTIFITIPTLKGIGVSGSGTLVSTNTFKGLEDLSVAVAGSGTVKLGAEAKSTEVAISGSGEVNLSGTSITLEIAISGSGDVIAQELKTDKCEVHISGSGDARVNVDKSLEAAISGSGDVFYTGSASVSSHVSGSGSVSKI
jgi:hypothetical protein